MGYAVIRRGDEVETFAGVIRLLRRALDVTGFGVNEFVFPPGYVGREHDEAEFEQEEVYLALEGSGTVTVDGEAEIPFEAGTYVRVDPTSSRLIVAGTEGLRFVVIGGVPGGIFTPRSVL